MRRSHRMVRNFFCGLLALGIIASGRVGRARRKALSGGTITSIYFHKPNRRLFAQCIGWLTRHGYIFISTRDMLDMLYNGKTPPAGAVWLTADDGNKEIL